MSSKLIRQSFLGENSNEILGNSKIAFTGLGGGGSHVVQQYAHLGLGNFVLLDFDRIEESNLNRLVGATARDVRDSKRKTTIAKRLIKSINPDANVIICNTPWQESSQYLRDCDLIYGCLDTFSQRRDLELFARRFIIPYIDIGMDVHYAGNQFSISGQVILSMPGGLCMHCMKFLREDLLEKEAAKYGDAGGKPQVIWPNGVLASTAVGLGVQLLTPWHQTKAGSIYLEYDGNMGVVYPSPRMKYLEGVVCQHFLDAESMGDPFYSTGFNRS